MILPIGLFPVHLPRPFRSPRSSLGADAPGGAHSCVLEFDADAAARGISDGLFGLAADAIAPQAATGRRKGRGRYTGEARLTGERTVRSTRRSLKGSIARMKMRKGCRKQGEKVLAY